MSSRAVLLHSSSPSNLGHVDPSKFSLEELSHFRGSMWTARWRDQRFGPRPGRPDNILAMDFYEYYHEDERAEMRSTYKARGYTHAVTGPMVDIGGYHNLYPTTNILVGDGQAVWDQYLDCMQEWWDDGIIPVHFVHPDGWNQAEMEALVPFYLQPRAQKLLRVIVWTGWEPTRYDWSAAQWQSMLARGNEVMPNALSCLHTVDDTDAPTGAGDDLIPGFTNGTAWSMVAPHVHAWLDQTAGYYVEDGRFKDRYSAAWPAQYERFKENFAYRYWDLRRRFHEGYAGWPTSSRWGNQPLKVVAAEFAAYPNFWYNWPESDSIELGDLAFQSGADGGYLDGGSIPT